VKLFQLIFNFLCSSPVAFPDKKCFVDCHVSYQLEFSTSRILKTYAFLMSQFMLVIYIYYGISYKQYI